jgi:hypothetical protein
MLKTSVIFFIAVPFRLVEVLKIALALSHPVRQQQAGVV